MCIDNVISSALDCGHIYHINATTFLQILYNLNNKYINFISSSDWAPYARDNIRRWVQFYSFWLNHTRRYDIKTYILRYEDMLQDLDGTLRGIARFLEISPPEDIIQCTLQNREGQFHRKSDSLTQHLDFYDDTFRLKMWQNMIENEIELCTKAEHCIKGT